MDRRYVARALIANAAWARRIDPKLESTLPDSGGRANDIATAVRKKPARTTR